MPEPDDDEYPFDAEEVGPCPNTPDLFADEDISLSNELTGGQDFR